VEDLIKQRIYALALGYEDLNDHDRLRQDVLMGLLCEKSDPSGSQRARERDQGKALAGKSTLNRLELTPEGANEKSRYKKIVIEAEKLDELMVQVCIESQEQAPARWSWMWMPPTIRCMGIKRGDFFMGIMGSIAIYRCIFFGGSICCVRGCERQARTRPVQ
jgi:hypothetical protein